MLRWLYLALATTSCARSRSLSPAAWCRMPCGWRILCGSQRLQATNRPASPEIDESATAAPGANHQNSADVPYRQRVMMLYPIPILIRSRHFYKPVALHALTAALLIFSACAGCRRAQPTVAVIPRTCGSALWEPEHAGAAA